MQARTENLTAIVFSESLEERDYLRTRISEFGLKVVCFENEANCFDNIKSIAPKIVMAQTDSYQVAWRFVFAVSAMDQVCPLLLVSDMLNVDGILNKGAKLPIYTVAKQVKDDRLADLLWNILKSDNVDVEMEHPPFFIGRNKTINELRAALPGLAESQDCVLISGERGTGKELLVRLIARKTGTDTCLIKIDCGALAPAMLTNGWFEKMMGDSEFSNLVTVFLDDVHLLSKQIQGAILSMMEAADHWRAQKETGRPPVRFLATSETPLESLVATDKFRKDLFYRLNVIPISMPPLRERKEDISLLMDYFIINAGIKGRKCIMIPSQNARNILHLHDWPGNIEELKTYMRRVSLDGNESCILDNGNLPNAQPDTKDHLFKSASVEELPKSHEIKRFLPDAGEFSLKHICEEFVSRTEKKLMKRALESTNWNRKRAAKLLNISYKSMLNKMKAYDII